MKAGPVLHEKKVVTNRASGISAIVELKIWSVPKSRDYRTGIKYSLYLVAQGNVIVGMDNHKPKGPHLHLGEQELPYLFRGIPKLLADFWDLVRKAGFEA